MFYDNYVRLCNSINKTPSAVAVEIGLQKSTVTRWSKGTKPNYATAQKVADYFGVPTETLLDGVIFGSSIEEIFVEESKRLGIPVEELKDTFLRRRGDTKPLSKESIAEYFDSVYKKAPTPEGERKATDEEIKFALFGGDGDITDAMYDEVKRFAQMVKLREEAEKKKE